VFEFRWPVSPHPGHDLERSFAEDPPSTARSVSLRHGEFVVVGRREQIGLMQREVELALQWLSALSTDR